MPPKLGDTVFVNQRDEFTGKQTVSTAIVTHVYSADDGEPGWWNSVKDKGVIDVTIFYRGGGTAPATITQKETVTVDDGAGNVVQYPVGYSTTPDGFNTDAAPAAQQPKDSANVLDAGAVQQQGPGSDVPQPAV